MENRMISPDTIRKFIYGGKAHFTLHSMRSKRAFSYNIIKKKDADLFFVSFNAPEADEPLYLGYIKNDELRLTQKSALQSHDYPVTAINYLLQSLYTNHMNPNFIFLHECRCGVCGRPLTDNTSISCGIGPVCREKI